MNINPDWLNMQLLKKKAELKDVATLNVVKINREKLAEIDPKIACGHIDEGMLYDDHIMQLVHTVSDALDGRKWMVI